MFGSKVTLRLEYIVEEPKFEPYLETLEIPIEEYIVTEREVGGEPILGLQIKEESSGHSTYRLYRAPDKLPIDVDDGPSQQPRAILLKITWRDSFIDDGITATYIISGQEHLQDAIDEDRDDIEWKYILKKEDDKYYLIHKVPDVAGNMNACQTIEKDDGIDCRNPKTKRERTKCRVNDCPRPARRRRRSSWVPW